MQLLKIVFSIAKEESRPSDQGELAVYRVHTVQRERRSGETGTKLVHAESRESEVNWGEVIVRL